MFNGERLALRLFMISPSGSLSEIPPKLGRWTIQIQSIGIVEQ
jgi:hypothetical protein